jgi:hypothetical protein
MELGEPSEELAPGAVARGLRREPLARACDVAHVGDSECRVCNGPMYSAASGVDPSTTRQKGGDPFRSIHNASWSSTIDAVAPVTSCVISKMTLLSAVSCDERETAQGLLAGL